MSFSMTCASYKVSFPRKRFNSIIVDKLSGTYSCFFTLARPGKRNQKYHCCLFFLYGMLVHGSVTTTTTTPPPPSPQHFIHQYPFIFLGGERHCECNPKHKKRKKDFIPLGEGKFASFKFCKQSKPNRLNCTNRFLYFDDIRRFIPVRKESFECHWFHASIHHVGTVRDPLPSL